MQTSHTTTNTHTHPLEQWAHICIAGQIQKHREKQTATRAQSRKIKTKRDDSGSGVLTNTCTLREGHGQCTYRTHTRWHAAPHSSHFQSRAKRILLRLKIKQRQKVWNTQTPKRLMRWFLDWATAWWSVSLTGWRKTAAIEPKCT